MIVFVAVFFIGECNGSSSTSSASSSISFNEAKTFMKNRCGDIGQTYIDGKSSSLDNTRIYVFLTKGIRHPDFYCVTMITENKLEVLTTDCLWSDQRSRLECKSQLCEPLRYLIDFVEFTLL